MLELRLEAATARCKGSREGVNRSSIPASAWRVADRFTVKGHDQTASHLEATRIGVKLERFGVKVKGIELRCARPTGR